MKFNFRTMYRSKSEVDKHVSGLLHKVKNEHERNLRCFHIAQLYYKTQDYESTQRYVNMYLSVRDDSAAAYKLLGQALEGLGQKEKAIAAYTKSMKLESDQSDLILKMCELLCDKDVEFDPTIARYWSERASLLFPHSSPVFMLKEKLLTFDSAVSSKDLEELLHAELKAKPMDLNVRIKLLKLYAESGRTEIALNHAFDVESKQTVLNCRSWYQCIHNICKVYHRDNYTKCGWEFYIQWISALDRLCSLSISENASQSSDMSENADCILSLDQAIHHGSQSVSKPEILKEFLKHISAQLTYHICLFLMKKAKKDNSLWKETKRLISPLLLFASNSSFHKDQSGMLSLTTNNLDSYRKLVQQWLYQAQCRIVQSGYLLMSLVKENNSEKMFFDKVNHFTSSDWRNQIYKKISNIDTNSSVSHFISATDYSKVPLKIPSSNSLKPSSYVGSFENSYFGSLHHLVWLGLRTLKKLSILELKLPSFCTTSFKSLQLSIKNLDNIGVETINQLDVDSFLYATVFCTASILADQKINGYFSEDRPNILPADISSPLCTSEQSKWWSNLCNLVKGSSPQMSSNESMSDLRFSLQRGLEVVRGEGLSPFLIVALARTFDTRSKMSNVIEESEVCTARAFHLWKVAYPILERLASNKTVLALPKINDLFEYPLREINSQDAKTLFDEAKFFIGTYYMNVHKYEKAAEELKGIKTPQAMFNLALVFHKWAEEQIDGLKGEEITSEIRCRHVTLATKARDYLFSTRSMIKNDPKHSLHSNVDAKIIDVEEMLRRIEPENDVSEKDGNGSTDGSASYISGGTPITERLNMLTSSNQRKMFHHSSTPHKSAQFQEQRANRFNVSELIDLLSVQQSTSQLKMQQLFEQIKLVVDKLESISSEQRLQKNLIEGLNSRWNVFESEVKASISDIKKDMKRPELCNMFEEDDYTDEMLQQYQSYPQYYAPPQRVVQNTAPAPGAVSYVNPQYFSPRLDCTSYFNQQGALPFSEGQQLPDFLRQPKVSQPLLHSLPPNIPPLNLSSSGIPGPSRVVTGPVIPPNVMIPPSDGLQAVMPTVQPAPLSVTIPTNNRFSNTSASVPHNFQIPLPPQPKLNVEERVVEEETPPPTYDPLPDYKPLIPLPDEVEIYTGEEDEEIIFEKRAKLYRFVDKIWKERGVGTLKILKNKKTGRARILMRREQVYKICANHFITAEMELQPKADSKNAFVWSANDFADEKVQYEKLCVKFKTKEESDQFKGAFDKMLKELAELAEPHSIDNIVTPISTATEITTSGFGSNVVFSQISNVSSIPSSLPGPFSATTISYVKPGIENSLVTNTPFLATTTASVYHPKTTASPLVATSTTKISTSSNLPNMFSFSSSSSVQSSPFNMPLFSTIPKVTETLTPQSQPTKVGGFTFSLGQPKLKIPEKPKVDKVEEPKEPGPLTKFTFPTITSPSKDKLSNAFSNLSTPKTNFLSSYTYTSTTSPSTSLTTLSGNKPENPSQLNISSQSKSGNVADTSARSDTLLGTSAKDDGDADSFVPTAEFEPTIPLPNLITVTTGEENEEVVFEERSQLYRYCKDTKQWKEKGRGLMKILKHKENGSHRLLMRREQVFKVCCNHRITADINMETAASSDKAVTWGAVDHSEEKPVNEIFSLKFKTIEQTMKFMEAVENIQAELNLSTPSNNDSVKNDSLAKPSGSENLPSLAEVLKPKPGSWECKDCYTRNNAGVDSCIACRCLKPGAIKTTTPLSSAQTFSFGAAPPDQSTPSRPFNFGTPLITASTPVVFKPPDSSAGKEFSFGFGTNLFGDTTKQPFTTMTTSTVAPSKMGFVFPSPTSLTKTESATFQFSMTATSPNKSQTDESGYDPEEEADHFQFEPVVRMPQKVEIVTGEEDENVLYSHRAKLYRFDKNAKEWKERGVGDIKILEHKETGKIRFLMRREPIMKVCLNHRITEDISLRPMNSKSWIWYALDYSEGTHTEEQFALRFKSDDIAQEFYKEFNKIKERINDQASSLTTPGDEKKLEKEKTKEPSNAENNSGSDSDVEFVSIVEASPELVEKALSLKLPANYYLYLEKSPCPGCCGCEPDDSDDLPSDNKNLDKKNEPTEVKKTIEDNKPFHDNIFGKALASEYSGFSNSTSLSAPPSAATFTFAQKFTSSPLDEKIETQSVELFSTPKNNVVQTGTFFFQNAPSFSSLTPTTNIFSTGPSIATQNTPTFGFLAKENPTFQSVASESQVDKGTPPAFVSKEFPTFDSLAKGQSFVAESKPNNNFTWEGAGQVLFSNINRSKKLDSFTVKSPDEDNEDEADDNDKSDNKDNDPYFEPIIALPPEIEVRTGEEDEEKLFSERGKLYRYDTDKKEWKERGLGDMKILKHKEKNVFRILMRREFVHKTVCNHLINKDILLKDKGENAFCWSANNFAEDNTTPVIEQLCIKFKNSEIAKVFKETVDRCIQMSNGEHSG